MAFHTSQLAIVQVFAWALLIMGFGFYAVQASRPVRAEGYSEGAYGTCAFGYMGCSITMTTNAFVLLNVLPVGDTTCTVGSDAVVVSAMSASGYNLSISANYPSSALLGPNGSIPSINATSIAPTLLTKNSWGYRVNGVDAFGTTPADDGVNISVPLVPFAAMPLPDAPQRIASKDSIVSNDTTRVSYGMCAGQSMSSGTYTATIDYKAVAN